MTVDIVSPSRGADRPRFAPSFALFEQGKRSVGSRVYKMIADNGVVGTLEKLVERPTDGLIFLIEKDREDLAAEKLVLDARFKLAIPDELRDKAERNLRMARAARGD
jgi:hypothetical protein